MVTRLVVSLLVAVIAFTTGPREAVRAAAPVPTATVVQDGLVIPWDLAFAPDGTMFVTERAGRIRVYASGAPGAALLHTTTVPSVRSEHESGLNGIAVDVNFASNRFIYVCASRDPLPNETVDNDANWTNQVLRYRVTPQRTLADGTVIFGDEPDAFARAAFQHNGCSVEMDASGRLWVGIGDARDPADAQDPTTYNGKILRMNRDGSIPDDNPVMPGADDRSLVYSMGHRNPQGIAFQPGTSRVYAAEHGPNENDEINRIQAGGNYGWPCYTGADTEFTPEVCGLPATDFLAPAWASGASTIATSGITFLDHAMWGDWRGSAFVMQLKQQDVRRFVPSANGATLTAADLFLDGDYGRLRAAVQGPDGTLYATTSNGVDDAVLRIAPGSVSVERFSGADRYATAALVSQRTFAKGVPVVYVATGATYPDALTGGAGAAANNAPVLLVSPSGVPTATRTEILRLAPQRIVVLGGPSAVSESVRGQLAKLVPGGASRVAGPDRYATAAAVSLANFGSGVPVAYIATGVDYPDALGAVPAAGIERGPILLVRPGAIPAPTKAELGRLKPQRIVVLGGTAAVSAAIATQLDAYTTGPVQRRNGADRYETAVAVSVASFRSADRVFIATGANFPDGLAGGPAGASLRAPLLLVRPDSLPTSVRNELLRLSPSRVTILGGPNAVAESVRSAITQLLGP
ncbi:MAG TPA: PQQ-dependent sugar dehydrogenase [Candidatus Limnocylindria bacterium]|nr:PQQ-dependent sugar dehydrogenase [Candidatus Limnocylindria bacterium]